MSPLPVKGCRFWPMLGTNGHWAWTLACHTICDTKHSFIMEISEEPWHSHLLSSVQWSCHYLFLRLKFVVPGIRTPNLTHARRKLNPTLPPPLSGNDKPTNTIRCSLGSKGNSRALCDDHKTVLWYLTSVIGLSRNLTIAELSRECLPLNLEHVPLFVGGYTFTDT